MKNKLGRMKRKKTAAKNVITKFVNARFEFVWRITHETRQTNHMTTDFDINLMNQNHVSTSLMS